MSIPSAARLPLLAAVLSASIPASAFQQASLHWEDIQDSTLREEIAHLGPYPEMHLPASASDLQDVPLRSWSALHSEFADASVRVRIEAQPFSRPEWVKGNTAKGFTLEGRPILGWSTNATHDRISRVELVLDGEVTEVPEAAFTDLFDLQPCAQGPVAPLRFTTVARSADGWRIYVLAQVGEGEQARLVTWVFEDGRYLFRVVDAFRTSG